MSLSRIDHALYIAGADSKMSGIARAAILHHAGIPRGRIITQDHGGKLLTTGRQTKEVLERLAQAHPDALNLVMFAGRVDDQWWHLIQQAYEIVLQHSVRPEEDIDIEAAVSSLGPILENIGHLRVAFGDFARGNPDEPAKNLVIAREAANLRPRMAPLHEKVMAKVRERLILVMLTGGSDYALAGRVAADLGIIDGAHINLEVTGQLLQKHLVKCVRRRTEVC